MVYTFAKSERFRTIYLVSMLLAKEADVEFHALQSPAVPEELGRAYQFSTPFFADRGLVAFGPALDELIHERYPGPSFMPQLPTQRAQMRMLVADVQSWYSLDTERLVAKLQEAGDSYPGSGYYLTTEPSAIDWALAPLLEYAVTEQLPVFDNPKFKLYAKRILGNKAYAVASDLVHSG